jgi:hypothetical protein
MPTFEIGDLLTADALNAVADPPVCKLIQQVAQNLASATDVALTFGSGSTSIDPLSMHSETVNNTRITPNVSGIYEVNCTGIATAPGAAITYTLLVASIFFNGAAVACRKRVGGPAAANTSASVDVFTRLEFNGSTDYVEFNLAQTASTPATKTTNVGGSFASTFEVKRIGPLAANY